MKKLLIWVSHYKSRVSILYGIKGWVHLIHKCLYQRASRFSYQTVKLSYTSKANFCLRRVLYQIAIWTNIIVLTKQQLAHLFLASAMFTHVATFSSRRTCKKAWASFWYHLLFYWGELRGKCLNALNYSCSL